MDVGHICVLTSCRYCPFCKSTTHAGIAMNDEYFVRPKSRRVDKHLSRHHLGFGRQSVHVDLRIGSVGVSIRILYDDMNVRIPFTRGGKRKDKPCRISHYSVRLLVNASSPLTNKWAWERYPCGIVASTMTGIHLIVGENVIRLSKRSKFISTIACR